MGLLWQLQNLLCTTYKLLPSWASGPGVLGVFRGKKFKTAIPSNFDKDHDHFEDIVKVFVTSQPTSFDFLELPKVVE